MEHIQGGELFEHVVESGSLSEHDAARVLVVVSNIFYLMFTPKIGEMIQLDYITCQLG